MFCVDRFEQIVPALAWKLIKYMVLNKQGSYDTK